MLADLLALGISDNLSADELNFVVAVGSLLLTKTAQMQILQTKSRIRSSKLII